MNQKKNFFLLLFFINLTIYSQTISGIVYNSKTKLPLENIAISTSKNTGTTTDLEGKYSLNISNITFVSFTSLGFTKKKILLSELSKKNFIVYLEEDVNLLDEISLTVSKISLDSLITRTKDSMKKNFVGRARKQEFYVRYAQILDFEDLDLDLKKSTLLSRKKRKQAKEELEKTSKDFLTKKPKTVSEYFTFSSPIKIIKDSTKIDIKKRFLISDKIDSVKGFSKSDIGNGLKIEEIEKKLSKIVLKYLDTSKTYKTKSGFFKLEDSLSFKEVIREADSLRENPSFSPRNGVYVKNRAYYKSSFFNKKKQQNFLDQDYYYHKLLGNQLVKNKMMYVISFWPKKSKAKLSGEIFINPKDYCIRKVTYQFAENRRGQHLNLKFLFGIKFSENVKSGELFYEKNNEEKVYLSYHKESTRNYAFIDRPIKFIENSSENEKIKFNILVSLNVIDTKEFFSNNTLEVNENEITEITTKKKLYNRKQNPLKKYMTLQEYNSATWTDRKLITEYLQN